MISADIRSEIDTLSEIAERADRFLAHAPEGSLVIAKKRNAPQYYLSIGKGKRKYIPQSQKEKAAALAQKSYARKVSKTARALIEHLEQLLALEGGTATETQATSRKKPANDPKGKRDERRNMARNLPYQAPKKAFCLMTEGVERLQRRPLSPLRPIKAAYDQLPSERKDLVIPYVTPDEKYIAQWEQRLPNSAYAMAQPGTFGTEKGDLVRSKSEVIIADRLYRAGVPYRYEQPVRVGETGAVMHPDFLILDPATRQEIIWEHFGLMDDPDYVTNALGKISAYASCGLLPGHGLIVTFESAEQPLGLQEVSAMVRSLSTVTGGYVAIA